MWYDEETELHKLTEIKKEYEREKIEIEKKIKNISGIIKRTKKGEVCKRNNKKEE